MIKLLSVYRMHW